PPMAAITFAANYAPEPPLAPKGFQQSGQNGVTIQQNGQDVYIHDAGEFNEAGATHDSTSGGVGPGQVLVFTVLMEAKSLTPNGQPVKVVGDPADAPATEIVLKNDPTVGQSPVTLTDTQVFLR